MADVDALVDELTLDEKAALTAGLDTWSTNAVPRLGIPTVYLTDGPNGARGPALGTAGPPSVCVPCGSALGATWDAALIREVGALLGREARRTRARVLLAPTLNLHRSPLAGRNFECYSEDPLLAGTLGAAFVRGAQSQGVATTVKHLVGNDAEFERHGISSVIDERALRELYLRPFELAIRDGGALGVMTSYNRLNGTYTTEQPGLLGDIVREEWGFTGFVLTDWFGYVGTTVSPAAGVDLEMPGPARAFGPAIAAAVRAGELDERVVDEQVRRLLTVFDRIGALGDPVDGDRTIPTDDRPEDRELARRAAASSMVLLTNDGTLPLDRSTLATVAVIGPNALAARIMGGGSATVHAHHETPPVDALRARLGPDVRVVAEVGCRNDKLLPLLGGPITAAPSTGAPGWDVEVIAHPHLEGEVVDTFTLPEGDWLTFEPPSPHVDAGSWSVRARTRVTPPQSGTYELGLVQISPARLLVGGEAVIDGIAERPGRGDAFFGMGSVEARATVDLAGGEPVEVVVEYPAGERAAVGAWRVGWRASDPPGLMDRAVAAAGAADVAVVVVGTTGDWESEGHDRTTMDLPGDQDELVRRVAAANPRTVVVVNTGAPVTMDWVTEAAAVLQSWFGGQEMADALADVLLGDAEPGGRLPTTLPERLEHNPSYGNFPGENGETRYGEGVLMGYRWYDARHLPTRFPFGHGLSYTSFELGEPTLSSPVFRPGGELTVAVPVTNTGDRPGSEVVQCYVAPPQPTRLIRPPKELAAFAKLWLEPGETATVRLSLDVGAFAYWDPGQDDRAEVDAKLAGLPVQAGRRRGRRGWHVEVGAHRLLIGHSSADLPHAVEIQVMNTD